MTTILPFLKSLVSVSGLSAYETPVAQLIEQKWGPLVDEVSLSRLGSLHGLKKGSGKSPRPSLLIATHMDTIGLMVTGLVDGFLHLTVIGDVDPRILPGTPVVVHATKGSRQQDLTGVIAMPPARLLPDGEGKGAVDLKYLLVDTGLTAREVSKRVQIGDLVAFGTEPVEMSGGIVSGHALDNRASVAALTICFEELRARSHVWDVWAIATVQEEITFGGATTSVFQLQPTLAIALDTTYGKGTSVNGWDSFKLGTGPTLGIGPSIHPFLHKSFKDLAEMLEIQFSIEPIPNSSLTDADAMQLAANGVPTMVICIPVRNLHTPVEMVSLKDIYSAGHLLAEFVLSLEADFVEKITWD